MQSENLTIFQSLRFLREINFEECKSSKSGIFAIRVSNILIGVNFRLKKMQKFMKNQNSSPLNLLK